MPSVEFLKTFADAWNRHDVDAVMAHMADECEFVSSSGSRHTGLEAAREAFSGILEAFPDARWGDDRHFVSGDRGVSEWVFSGTDSEDGSTIRERGCDIFTFRDGGIVLKDTYLNLS